MSHDLTRWIEVADAREFSETVAFERGVDTGEHHYLHLGDAVAHLPSWLKHGISRESLASIGCHAIAFVRGEHQHTGC
jgi:hypothetical protein